MTLNNVAFSLVPDEEGYPPESEEVVSAVEVMPEYVQLLVPPFFTREACLGDIVHISFQEGVAWFDSIYQRSNYSLLRVIYFDITHRNTLEYELTQLGCTVATHEIYSMTAIAVPTTTSLKDVQDILAVGFSQGHWDYEEPILRHD